MVTQEAFRWKHNALRHSFISYRVAQTKNVAEVSFEAGNSPQMIHKHYRELVKEDAAKEWFSIEPPEMPLPSSAMQKTRADSGKAAAEPSPAK